VVGTIPIKSCQSTQDTEELWRIVQPGAQRPYAGVDLFYLWSSTPFGDLEDLRIYKLQVDFTMDTCGGLCECSEESHAPGHMMQGFLIRRPRKRSLP
jgi:hypothetical protein